MKNRKAKLLTAKPGSLSASQIDLLFVMRLLALPCGYQRIFTVSGDVEARRKTAGKTTCALKESDMATLQELIDLTPEQKKAWNRLVKAVKDFRAAGESFIASGHAERIQRRARCQH